MMLVTLPFLSFSHDHASSVISSCSPTNAKVVLHGIGTIAKVVAKPLLQKL